MYSLFQSKLCVKNNEIESNKFVQTKLVYYTFIIQQLTMPAIQILLKPVCWFKIKYL